MLPINTNASARDTIKADHISSNSHQGKEPATDENYQDILSSLEQEPGSGEGSSQDEQHRQAMSTQSPATPGQLTPENDNGTLAEQQANLPQPGLSADQAAEQISVEVPASQLADERADRQLISRANAAEIKNLNGDNSQLPKGEVKVGQSQEQVPTAQGKLTAAQDKLTAKAEREVIPAASTEQIAQNLSKQASGETAAANPAIDSGKQAEQASQASSQAVSLLYRQQELQGTTKLSSDQLQIMTEQSTRLGSKGLANTGALLNKLDGMQTAVLQQPLGDIRGMAEFSGAKVTTDGLTSSGQAQTFAVDPSLAERSQTANGKYEWSMLKLDSQRQNWSRQLFNTLQDRIEMQANQQIKQAKIRLDPPELGRLELMVRIEGDRMSVNVNASNAAVREALQETNERLRQELENQFGSSVDVNVGSDSSDQAFKNEEEMVAVANVEATEINQGSVPLTTGWLNALA
ncbi:flagellar hook-length control protein FliK [Thalassomonas haliotis]|uniref:Flagellar hook-length control protein FliK n=1 Tax=Thalassomonas haliotis TaxID=485448 RepID=A0ABY7VGC7_9GAMM|nr:flagellar hook-length control protein FliK [Thalassomonas haliotis]WDE12100.1 flagellar hook-length control protein FliK [Thalassomonas haliotis]